MPRTFRRRLGTLLIIDHAREGLQPGRSPSETQGRARRGNRGPSLIFPENSSSIPGPLPFVSAGFPAGYGRFPPGLTQGRPQTAAISVRAPATMNDKGFGDLLWSP
jgi:hypothetical protein